MLHLSPELCLEKRLRELEGLHYLTSDLTSPDVDINMDITDIINFTDEVFDVIFCSHVLEHIPDDRKAMREMCRVLRPDGWAIILVPITEKETIEDLAKDQPGGFGQRGHVRAYGLDYVNRLAEAGFKVGVFSPFDLCTVEETVEMGLSRAGEIYYCTKGGV